MGNLVAQDSGIPRTRYERFGMFSGQPRPPLISRARKIVLISFPVSPRLAYVVGAVYGDGSVSGRRLTYFNMDRTWIGSVADELRRLTESGNPKPRILPPGWRGCPSIEYCNAALARLVGGSETARLHPIELLTRSRKLLAAFVAGIFDTEGSATLYVNEGHKRGTPEISLANSNVGMLGILQSRLQRYGIKGGISLAAAPRTTTIGGRKIRWKKPVYRLRFSGWSSAISFAKFVLPWSMSQTKSTKLQEVVGDGAGRI